MAVCEAAPVAAIAPLFPAGTYRRGTTTEAVFTVQYRHVLIMTTSNNCIVNQVSITPLLRCCVRYSEFCVSSLMFRLISRSQADLHDEGGLKSIDTKQEEDGLKHKVGR